MSQQTVIPIAGESEFTFERFYVGANSFVLQQLKEAAKAEKPGSALFIWGRSGSGKTHILNACCHLAAIGKRPYHYVAVGDAGLGQIAERQIATNTLVCLDNVHRLGGHAEFEFAAMTVYEQVIQRGGNMVLAANSPLDQTQIKLADLISRFSSGGTYHLKRLDEASTRLALQQRAHHRGFTLNDQVMDFIMSRYTRDTTSLFALLDRIDAVSLQHQRKITVPFIRSLLQ